MRGREGKEEEKKRRGGADIRSGKDLVNSLEGKIKKRREKEKRELTSLPKKRRWNKKKKPAKGRESKVTVSYCVMPIFPFGRSSKEVKREVGKEEKI